MNKAQLEKLQCGLGALREALLIEAHAAQRSGHMGEYLRKVRAARLVSYWRAGALAALLTRSIYP